MPLPLSPSRDEWQWFKSLSTNDPQPLQAPNGPQSLQETLLYTIETFLHNLGIARDDVLHHQLYKYEAIELSEDITFLLLLPPAEHVCTAPGSSDHFASLSNFVALPINTFEISKFMPACPAFDEPFYSSLREPITCVSFVRFQNYSMYSVAVEEAFTMMCLY